MRVYFEDLSTAASEMDRQTVYYDWYWRMALAAGMTELWLAKGDRVRARLGATRYSQVHSAINTALQAVSSR
jgi:hypothetical protein